MREENTSHVKAITHHLPQADQCPATPQEIDTFEDKTSQLLLVNMVLYGMGYDLG